MLSVPEAAARLGVGPQRVHQRIQDGSLPAERIGGRWAIDEKDLVRLRSSGPGRPFSTRSAWALLAAADDDEGHLAGLSAPDRSRARARLRDLVESVVAADEHDAAVRLAQHLSAALRNRAVRHSYRAAPDDLGDLRDDGRVRLAGLSHPDSGLAAGNVVEGYVQSDDIEALRREYLLVEAAEDRANVFLHAVGLPGPMPRGWRSGLALAADLVDHGGPRELNRAIELLPIMLATPEDPR